jgi:hypothetical protein
MTSTTAPVRHKRPKQRRSFKELLQVRCSLPWFAAGAGAAGAGLLAIYAGGAPAAVALGTAAAAGLTYTTMVEPRTPVLERHTVRLPLLPPALDGLRIGMLADLHLGMPHCAANTRWGVQQMLREQPDLIVIPGDFVSFPHAIDELPDLLRPLRAPLGIYATTGNHDYWEGVEEIRRALEPLPIEFLINRNQCLHCRGAELWLAGIDDMWYGTPDLNAALEGIPEGACTVLLAHEPDFADIAALRPISLQLSGHTHGGHINVPGLGAPCLPHHGLRYVRGWVQVEDLPVYVTRGLGGAPVRLNSVPEATLITLRAG